MTYEQFVEYYNKWGKTPYQINKPKNPLNEKQLVSLYEKHERSSEKRQAATSRYIKTKNKNQIYRPDIKWVEVRKAAFKRDGDRCCFLSLFSTDYTNHASLEILGGLDPCHVFGKGAYPHMKYDVDNIVILHRLFHSRLDLFKHPLTGKLISKEERQEWWKKIVGEERFNKLQIKAKER